MKKPFFIIGLIIVIVLLLVVESVGVASAQEGQPLIWFTYVPPYGTPIWPSDHSDIATGFVQNIVLSEYHVVCYIYVPESLPYGQEGWWIKPHDDVIGGKNRWETPIEQDNNGDYIWGCDVATGGIDPKATIIEAYLVPEEGKPSTPPTRESLLAANYPKAVAIREPFTPTPTFTLTATRTPTATSTMPSINKSVFKSIGSQDGWILESSETSNKGGRMNSSATLLYVGDNVQDRQYRSILSFDTSNLSDDAVITKAQVKFNINGSAGSPCALGNLVADIRRPYFGNDVRLELIDFQSKANLNSVGVWKCIPALGWQTIRLKSIAHEFVNPTGTTQFRLRFTKDDNNDFGNDYLKIFSGNALAANRPQLVIEYYVP